ncbi:MAG: tetratricopeptide repeat protein [Myxococcota bacterium]|nr:tetratricopeptide repeat protein [Myxococcota bacterium]
MSTLLKGLIALSILLSIVSPQNLMADSVEMHDHQRGDIDTAAPAQLEKLWRERQHARRLGADARAEHKLQELVLIKTLSGWPNFTFYAQALVNETDALLHAGAYAKARDLLAKANLLAPELESVYWQKIRLLWAEDAAWIEMAGVLLTIVQNHWQNDLYRKVLKNQVFISVSLGFFFSVLLLSMIILYRHALLLSHDLSYLFRTGRKRLANHFLVLALILLPLVLQMGLAWTVLIWIVELGIYFAWPQRFAAMGLLGMLALWSMSLDYGLSAYAYPGSVAENIYYLSHDLGPNISRQEQKRAETPEQSYAKGLRSYWSGAFDEAQRRLEQAENLGSQDATLYALLGNLRFLSGDYTEAIRFYDEAIKEAPHEVLPYFNKARALHKLARMEEGLASHLEAVDLSRRQSEALRKQVQATGGLPAVYTKVPRELKEVRWDHHHNARSNLVWAWLGGDKTKRSYLWGSGLALLVLLLLSFLRKWLRPAQQCKRCGTIVSPRTEVALPKHARRCGRCYSVFSAVSRVSTQQRIAYENAILELQHKRQRQMRYLSMCLPGSGHMLMDAYLKGFACMFSFLSLLFLSMTFLLNIPEPLPLWNVQWTCEGVIAFTLCVLFYGVVIFSTRSQSSGT